MRKKFFYFVLTTIVALVAALMARQQTLQDLRMGNDSLRKQIEARESAPVTTVQEIPAISPAKLSDSDERELLQLRSKIQFLRDQLRGASNQVAVLRRIASRPVKH